MNAAKDTGQLQEKAILTKMDMTVCNGCNLCYLRCEERVPFSRGEFERVRMYIQSHRERECIEEVMTLDKREDMGDEVFFRLCRFLNKETNGCMVYPVRPLMCRLMGHIPFMPCPVDRVESELSEEDTRHILDLYAKEDRRTWNEWIESEEQSDEK
jgi:Fe-S-cluster containining protein